MPQLACAIANQLVDDRVRALGEEVRRRRSPRSAFICPGVRARVLAAQHAAPERRPRRDAEAELAAPSAPAPPRRCVRAASTRSAARRAATSRGSSAVRLRLRHLPGRRVRDADVAHLAGAHQIVERPHRLLDRRVPIPAVHPVEVDVVGLAAGAATARTRPRSTCGRRRRRWDRPGTGCRQNLVAMHQRDRAVPACVREVVADDVLGVALGVDVGGVDEVAAALDVARRGSPRTPPPSNPTPTSSPKVMAPRHNGLTRRPERPRVT